MSNTRSTSPSDRKVRGQGHTTDEVDEVDLEMMMLQEGRRDSATVHPAVTTSSASRCEKETASTPRTANASSPPLVIEVKSEPIDDGVDDLDLPSAAVDGLSFVPSATARPNLAAELEAARRENQALRDRIGEQDRRLTRFADDFYRVFGEFSRLSGQLQLLLDERGLRRTETTASNVKPVAPTKTTEIAP